MRMPQHGQKNGDAFAPEHTVFQGSFDRIDGDQRGAVHDDLGVLQADEGDKEADAGGDGGF